MSRLAPIALLLLLLAGCSGGSVVPAASTTPVSRLAVGMIDFRFQLGAAVLRPGVVTVVATNAGSTAHDAEFSQGGRPIGGSAVLEPGRSQTFTIRVAAGAPVHLECTIPGHDAAGMHATLRVAALSPAAGTGS